MKTLREGPVTGLRWTRDRVCEMARGAQVMVRDDLNRPLPVPAWLLAEAGCTEAEPWRADLDAIHPMDRPAAMRAWRRALSHPGEPCTADYRCRSGEVTHSQSAVVVNLLDELVGGMLIVTWDHHVTSDTDEWSSPTAADDTSAWLIGYIDEHGMLLRYEGALEQIYGRPAEELTGHRMLDFVHPAHHDTLVTAWLDMLNDPTVTRIVRSSIVRPDGTRVWVETTMLNRLDTPSVAAMMMVTHDISMRMAQDEELHRSRAEFQTLAEQMLTPVFRTDGQGHLTFTNRRWRETVASRTTPTDGLLVDLVHPDDRVALAGVLAEVSSPFGSDELSADVRDFEGERVFHLSMRAVGSPLDTICRPVVGGLEDISATAALVHQAHHDPLTGLLNRSGINDVIQEAIVLGDTVVVFLDLDGFKQVNDESGHDAGDRVLCEIGTRLRQAVRPGDEVGRYGGDEFVLMCHDIRTGAVHAIEARIRKVLAPAVAWETGSWQPAASLGSTRLRTTDDVAAVLRRADRAMYAHKHEPGAGPVG
jgi:diguanylate cyclase (GGDEF)-like protein/PAS domain S-box-containing protein